ncbi:hypothetical protein C8Q73DRAFT_347598 [Cubamyces lactineus]|nr:hypothetical protein C8Q73DRAFT_347598 [Cubamyces lactineus]
MSPQGTLIYTARATSAAALPCTATQLEYERMPTLGDMAKVLLHILRSRMSWTVERHSSGYAVLAVLLPIGVYWTMQSVPHHVHPLNSQEVNGSGNFLRTTWGVLDSYTIPGSGETASYTDQRSPNYSESRFLAAFLWIMQDVGYILLRIRGTSFPGRWRSPTSLRRSPPRSDPGSHPHPPVLGARRQSHSPYPWCLAHHCRQAGMAMNSTITAVNCVSQDAFTRLRYGDA